MIQLIQSVFWNNNERRVRAFWRIVGMFVILFAIVIAISVGAFVALPQQAPFVTSFTFSAMASLVATIVASWLAARFLDRRSFADLGFHIQPSWWLDLIFGFMLGAVLMTAIFLVESALGWVKVVATLQKADPNQPFIVALLSPIVLFLCVGIYEELLTRGYLLCNIAEGLNVPALGAKGAVIVAWLISSIIFGLGHMFNPNTTLISNINLVLAGVMLGLGFVLTRQLAIPIGFHISWNFFQGNVFGFPVSGQDLSTTTFWAIEQQGPVLWTGGAFGPEAGIIGILAMLAGSMAIVVWVRLRYGHIVLHNSLADFTNRDRI